MKHLTGSIAILTCIIINSSSVQAELQVFGSFEDSA
ncbi:MAG: hypothetical protein H6Q06_1449, partial [Acidobacteria bacterium]|nr:hypothetical protein [Acidobacteriota bacterium]